MKEKEGRGKRMEERKEKMREVEDKQKNRKLRDEVIKEGRQVKKRYIKYK